MGTWNGIELDDLVIDGDRLRIRPFVSADRPLIHAAMLDPRMHEFLTLPNPYTLDDAGSFIGDVSIRGRREGSAIEGAVVERASGRLVGSAALRLPARNAAAEIGYAVYPTGQGRGYAAETARMLSDWAFGHGTARVQIRAAVRNLASIRSALRAGFRYEGTARAGVDTAFGPVDGAVFARLPEEDRGPVLAAFAPLPDAGLTDDVVSLRPLRASDAGALYEMESDPQSRRWTFFAGGPTRAEMVAFAERAQLIWLVGGQASLAIVDRASAATAGTMTLRLAGPPAVGGIGYTVHPAFRGHGFTARALRLLRAWALRPVADGGAGFHRLELGAKRDDVASQRAARSGGFTDDGVRIARLREAGGGFADEVRFYALAGD